MAGKSKLLRYYSAGLCLYCVPDIVPKLKELEYELKEVDWYELGIHMNVPAHTLKNIGKDIASEARRLAEVLHYWLNNGEASWEAVVQALKRIGGHGNIIKTIEWEYFPSTSMCIKQLAGIK